ncbi:MAG: hypothetical protein ACYDAC_11700, partial [Candidatus Dormibacteria bacterium]
MTNLLDREVVAPTATGPAESPSPATPTPDVGVATAVPILRPSLAVGAAVIAVAVMLGGMFLGWESRLFAIVGGVEGVLLAAWTARARSVLLAQIGSLIAVAVLCILGTATAGAQQIGHLADIVQQAAAAGHQLRPPAVFDPGWRPLVLFLMASLGYCAGWVACGLQKPLAGIGATLPFLVMAAMSQDPGAQVPDGIAAFALIAAGVTVLYRESSDGVQFSLGFELRRALRSAPMVLGMVLVLVLVSRSNFLFPAPAYDPTQAAQVPKVVPLSAATDRRLFTVQSSITGPWRTGVLDVYDGRAWRFPPFSDAPPRVFSVGSTPIDPLLSSAVEADFEIFGLDGTALPIPARPVQVTPIPGQQLSYDSRAGQLHLQSGAVRPSMAYKVFAAASPTAAQLAQAKPDLADAKELLVPPPPAEVRSYLAFAPAAGWARAAWVRKTF